jgi:N utilization substance protein A
MTDRRDVATEVPEGVSSVTGLVISTTADVATVRTMDGSDLYLPITEWYPRRRWARGEKVVAVRRTFRGRPVASVTDPVLAMLLLEGLVPEVRDGRIRVMGVAREPGVRNKIAVAATIPGLDAVAACVGRGAGRVRALSAMLNGERTDIIAWDMDPLRYLMNAMAPAKVSAAAQVTDNGEVEVVAPRHQMAAAVGESGLNSQLAGRLTGHTVTVVPE